ncbi:MAG TPA: NAD(P)/FAD-dependent oxidoreductase [Gammaproteobacteria bacterium]|jgi:thioredoxin reductase (NADPH)|nr:NAD(P)/FAD-dependent oxidoreductase [Gammaproteobacteria bacterium]
MSKRVESDILIIGAGPVGLFTVFEAGLLGLNCQIIDNLDRVGGQCAELYPDKPIFDIPGVPYQTAEEHIGALLEQIKPFKYGLHLNQRVQEINQIDSKNEIQKWKVVTSENTEFIATNVFIAAGGGSFEPRRPPNIIDPDKFLNNGVAYSVKDKSYYQNKNLIIFGGGDSALDWSVELADIADSITLIHRRDAFRGSPGTEAQMRELVETGNLELKTPYVIEELLGTNKISGVSIKNFESKEIETLDCNEILFLFGLNKKLGPLENWNLKLNGKKISVDTEKYQTSIEGIYAVGDINDYPGKLDLILCGFHETTLAVQDAYQRCFPGERVPFAYTTSNTKLHKKLGIKID